MLPEPARWKRALRGRVTDPRLGETVLDPASGTGGFLIEAYNPLAKQVKTAADRKVLHEEPRFARKTPSWP